MKPTFENMNPEVGHAELVFSLSEDKKKGFVINGGWWFNVIEFKPPYMKVTVLHPRKPFVAEYFHVREALDE